MWIFFQIFRLEIFSQQLGKKILFDIGNEAPFGSLINPKRNTDLAGGIVVNTDEEEEEADVLVNRSQNLLIQPPQGTKWRWS